MKHLNFHGYILSKDLFMLRQFQNKRKGMRQMCISQNDNLYGNLQEEIYMKKS